MISQSGSISGLISIPDESVSLGGEINPDEEPDQPKHYDIGFILFHPKLTIRIFFETLRYQEYLFNWLLQAVGRLMAGRTITIDGWNIFVYLILLIISSFIIQGQTAVVQAADRALFLFISACVIGAAMFVMFVGWTPYGSSTVGGIQGRYFIPIVPLLFMSLNNTMIRVFRPIEKMLIAVGVFINLSILNQILLLTLKP